MINELLRKNVCRILGIVLVALMFCTVPVTTHAESKTVILGHEYCEGIEYQWLKTTETKWTSYKYVTSKWYWLAKGDQLFYFESKGNPTTVNVSVGYGGSSVGVSVPLGKKCGPGEGVAKTAKSKGYYKIKAKKKVFIDVRSTRTRRVDANNKPISKWSKPYTTKKTYTVKNVYSKLIKKK